MTGLHEQTLEPTSPRRAHGVAITIAEGYCINLRGRIDACDLCQRACPAGSIRLTPDSVTIDPVTCVSCGGCVPACPAGAFELDGLDPDSLVAQAGGRKELRIGCAQTEDKDIALPCHRMTDARLMAALFAEGVDEIILTGTENCHDCPSGGARKALSAAHRKLVNWFGDRAPLVRAARPVDHDAQDDQKAAERRRLLRGAFRSLGGKAETEQSELGFDDFIAPDHEVGEATARPVAWHRILADRWDRLPFRKDSPVGATGRKIDDNCSGCLVCADLCPTGALNGRGGNGQRTVSFDPYRCTNCTLCLKVCPQNAISARALRGVASATAGRDVLFARRENVCTICGNGYLGAAEGDGMCPACRNEQEMEEEWLEMLSG